MNSFNLEISTKLIYGVGSINKISEAAAKYGKKALLVTTGKDLDKVGILGRVVSLLEESAIEVVIFDGVSPNPRTHNVNEGVGIFKEHNCDFVIGLGGGSAMDCAKAIALVAKNGGIINDYVFDGKYANMEIQSKYPCICVATTAGTGSEVTNFCVLIVPETHENRALVFRALRQKCQL